MEELFRFSVIRAATRSVAATVSLDHPSPQQQPTPPPLPITPPPPPLAAARPISQPTSRVATRPVVLSSLPAFIASRVNLGGGGIVVQPQPPKPFQEQLREKVQESDAHELTAEAIWQQLEPIALDFLQHQAPAILINTLWLALLDFQLNEVQEILTDNASSTIGSFINKLDKWKESTHSTIPNYQLDLADLFLALMIIRRGGPVHLDTIIRQNKLWDALDFLGDNPTLQEIADRIRIIDLVKAGSAGLISSEAKTPAEKLNALQSAIRTAMNETLLLPPGIFGWLRKPIHGIGFRELHVVNQHIRCYEMAEIGRIENILKGESRAHTQKHTLSNERDTFVETQTTTETDKELTTTDHVDIKNETENQLKEDTKVDAGVHAQYSGPSFKLQTDLNVSYDKSTEVTKKFSSDVAKDVTQKAVSKVTQRVTQSQTTKIIETFEETEEQSFDNKNGQAHVSGVYQWVQKVYLAQVFNLGRHMVLDIMVPEPGSSLLSLATIPAPDQQLPTAPLPLKWVSFPSGTNKPSRLLRADDDIRSLQNNEQGLINDLKPEDLDADELDDNLPKSGISYMEWIGRYGVTGTSPSPNKFVSAGKAISRNNDGGDLAAEDEIRLPDGYEALTAYVQTGWKHAAHDNETGVVTVKLGGSTAVTATEDAPLDPSVIRAKQPSSNRGDQDQNSYFVDRLVFKDLTQDTYDAATHTYSPIVGAVPIAVSAPNIGQVSISIEIRCRRLGSALRQWQLQTYEKIITAWQKLQSDYESKLAAMQFQKATVGPLGATDPEANRLTERTELKRECIAILDNSNQTVRGVSKNIAIQNWPDPKPVDPNDPSNPVLPEPILPFGFNPQNNKTAQELGVYVRWFEQAFEWENIAYVLYPYFWGRRQLWPQRLNLRNDDPLFLKFLQAGYARVVLPVRLGFEWAVHFYFHTGLPWLGGGLPPIGDKTQNPLYLDIAEEIKALTGGGEAGEAETPIGEPWEYTLPTTLIKLRKDDALPEWHRLGVDGNEDENKYPSDEPGGPWTWSTGAPK